MRFCCESLLLTANVVACGVNLIVTRCLESVEDLVVLIKRSHSSTRRWVWTVRNGQSSDNFIATSYLPESHASKNDAVLWALSNERHGGGVSKDVQLVQQSTFCIHIEVFAV